MSSPSSLHSRHALDASSTTKFGGLSDSIHELPKTPNPSSDTRLAIPPSSSKTAISPPPSTSLDIFTLPPVAALRLLCAGVEALVRVTGDIPPTPPPSHPTTPNMRGIQAEKENIVRSRSCTSLNSHQGSQGPSEPIGGPENIDGIKFRETPLDIGPKEPYADIGANTKPLNPQHSAITRKFYSKQPPLISLEDYLMRIHKYCPMSTGVYLATSVYIHRLAVEECAIPVTRRNSHRLLLAGLRVAMKALEDHSYPHKRFSKVGGVSESELARLEISFCFLTNFELRTTKEVLLQQALNLKEISITQAVVGDYGWGLRLPLRTKDKKSVNIPIQETMLEVTADA